jgi:hypothetical protein
MFAKVVFILETYVDGMPFFWNMCLSDYWLACSHCGTACSHFNKVDFVGAAVDEHISSPDI